MGYDPFEDSELANLPPEAYGNVFDTDGPFDPDNNWLRTAERDDQLTAMREWFLARYCDPTHETPYNGREGGYLFINGGPYDPGDEIPDRFSGIVDEDLIQEVVDELVGEHGDAWAPVNHAPDDEWDERFDFDVSARSAPLARLRERLAQAKKILGLQGDAETKDLAMKLVFSNSIGVLEAFLYETVYYWVDNDKAVLESIVRKLPVFRDEKIALGEMFERQEGLVTHVKGHLQNMVWHRWDKVVPFFKLGLEIKLPSLKAFDAPLQKRHDIVHRGGYDKVGDSVQILREELDALFVAIETFAFEVDKLLIERAEKVAVVDGELPDF